MKKENIYKVLFYLLGLAILSLGLILNSKSNLGTSPIVSVAYIFGDIFGISLSSATLYQYIIFIIIQMILHSRMKLDNLKLQLIQDASQIIVSFIFTSFMSLFSYHVPLASNMLIQILFIIFGTICTGIGAALSLDARLIPNPGDGITQSISDTIGKEVGLTKNIVDVTCVLTTIIVSLIFKGKIIGVGIGTLVCVIFTGRVITLFNKIFKDKIDTLCGLNK